MTLFSFHFCFSGLTSFPLAKMRWLFRARYSGRGSFAPLHLFSIIFYYDMRKQIFDDRKVTFIARPFAASSVPLSRQYAIFLFRATTMPKASRGLQLYITIYTSRLSCRCKREHISSHGIIFRHASIYIASVYRLVQFKSPRRGLPGYGRRHATVIGFSAFQQRLRAE